MSKQMKIIYSIISIILGWLFLGIGYAEPLPFQLNTILFLLGFIMCPGGVVFLLITLAINNGKTLAEKIDILNSKKLSKNWNPNLYDICLSHIKSIRSYKYFHEPFRSWEIETNQKRLIYDGELSQIVLQEKNLTEWKTEEVIKRNDLYDSNLFPLLDKM